MESESTGHFDNISLLFNRTKLESRAFGSVLVAICITTLFGNGLVIAALVKSWHNTVTKPGNYLALHLALADVLNGLLTMTLCCVSFFATEWLFGDTMCKVSGFLLIFFTTSSNSFLSMISLNRYYRVKNPSVRGSTLRRRAFFMTMLCWVSGLVTGMASASGHARIVFIPGFDVNCMVVWDTSAKGLINMAFICSLLFCVPFCVMTVTYVQIFGLVRGRTATVEPDARVSRIARAESISVPANSSQPHRRNTLNVIQQFLTTRAEMKTAATLSMVLGLFAICWIPVMVVHALRTFKVESLSAAVQSVAILLMYLSSACNPVIYSLRNTSFRAEITDMFSRWRSQSHKTSNRPTV
ncbi:probable G-protein coupled receptor No9 [Liolophura sinensis]|uniref:probable G-protein coupled receptor No9 n=1 Tax=Liolophura sinensis TaxID=3198878 RepID=UPI003158BCC0